MSSAIQTHKSKSRLLHSTIVMLLVTGLSFSAARGQDVSQQTAVGTNAAASESTTTTTTEPVWRRTLKRVPQDFGLFFRNLAGYSWETYASVVGATLLLMPYDQKIVGTTVDYTTRHHLLARGAQDRAVMTVPMPWHEEQIRAPKNLTGVIWYFGDSTFHFFLVAGLATYSFNTGDYRSAGTAVQILEAMLLSGPLVIGTKVMTGRESPSKATRDGGVWHGYPGLQTYAKDQSKYYAFPSGHVTAATATLTVLLENYPEKTWILPVGSVMVGSLMAVLMNVGAHWPSDYPLALLIGYTAGRTAAESGRELALAKNAEGQDIAAAPPRWRWQGMTPVVTSDGYGLGLNWRY